MNARLATAVAALALAAVPAPATAAAIPPPLLAAARLQGFWRVSGVVTKAVNVPGERRGDPVIRTWGFVPECPTGPCPTLRLARQRAGAYDNVPLHATQPGVYLGSGSFYAPARCRGTLFRRGERVPYTIRVTITAVAQQPDGSVLATAFTASYRNRQRLGLTRCYSAPSYDSARYAGLPAPPPPSGAIRTERRIRSSAGS